ncbi:bifunctional transcriptional activator/DNA repair enzyme AdaA [Pontibacillus yanchengensis]|uniref:methylated-DNA--[protein]-cysteine S-methyltransferase n=1 Tax=Pontibacillus yanchengensis Y32 TaxID=1385514 RepID=A0A0A2TVF0_9BACI|nr:trifunctional transcriptional activator/DNA repair protein Ada/methylated-DNA--[protein]-cysteine S-methyltransferase [Pontibacillus yanchengensis]KGP73255.1 cysteine methyltransferase [Pontibacillus yanchengensis Y32]
MITTESKEKLYQALLERNAEYEGVFFVGVITTGIFCRPTCPARKPKLENCEFYQTAQQALLASYRPCQRCRPLSHPNHETELVRMLVDAVEGNPEKRWKDADLQGLSVDPSTARRHFKKRFGMTFVEYARARRMGVAMKHIRAGDKVIDTQISTGYESSSGFRDAFSRIMGEPPTSNKQTQVLYASWLDTELGPMIAIADEHALYLLEFVDRRGLEKEIERLRFRNNSAIVPGETEPIRLIEQELKEYFTGSLKAFTTPVHFIGTPFQKRVWEQLRNIAFGDKITYTKVAEQIGKPTAFRAVANANGTNQLAIIVPCHRVIREDGNLAGYGGGMHRKRWLLEHEEKRS